MEKNKAKYSTISVQSLWLIVWTFNNISVTLLNKSAFAKVDFPYPYMLSAIHMACNVIGAHLYFFFSKSTKPKALEGWNRVTVYLFSILFTLNITIGNVSLKYVSVNFNQVLRSLVPIIVLIIEFSLLHKPISTDVKLAVLPIVVGVALACLGEMRFTNLGFFITVICCILAAIKVIMSGSMLTGDLKLHPIDLLSKMCPLALLQMLAASYLSGEIDLLFGDLLKLPMDAPKVKSAFTVVLLSGIASYFLNVTSFIANRETSPLTLSIAANVKQVLLIIISTVFFHTPVSMINAIGIVIVLIGGAKYSIISVMEQEKGKSNVLVEADDREKKPQWFGERLYGWLYRK